MLIVTNIIQKWIGQEIKSGGGGTVIIDKVVRGHPLGSQTF